MPNLAATLKDEIRRLAKKEIKNETGKTQKAVAQYRRDIARLKKQVGAQEKEIAVLKKQEQKPVRQPATNGEAAENARFSARSVQSQRKRTGLSAQKYAKLVGVSPLTIYNWEHGKARPRGPQLARLVAVRGIGKREATRMLEMLKAKEQQGAKRVRKLGRKKPK